MEPVVIIGGGLSGLIAAYALNQAGKDFILFERQESTPIPKIHYVHEEVKSWIQYPMESFEVTTNFLWNNEFCTGPATIEQMNAFSSITTGTITANSMKYISPTGPRIGWLPKGGFSKFVQTISDSLPRQKLNYGIRVNNVDVKNHTVDVLNGRVFAYSSLINTIPLPIFIRICDLDHFKRAQFKSAPMKGIEVSGLEETVRDLYQILYLPQGDGGFARISVLGSSVIAECANTPEIASIEVLVELIKRFVPTCYPLNLKYENYVVPEGRFIPIDPSLLDPIITHFHNDQIYMLGRYAEWSYRRFDHVVRRAFNLINAI